MYKFLYKLSKNNVLNSSTTTLDLTKMGLKQVKSENLAIVCVWTFVLVIVVGFVSAGILWTDYDMFANAFNAGLLLFFIALIFTGAIVHLTPEKVNGETKLRYELQKLKSKLDELNSEVEHIKNPSINRARPKSSG